ncbi:hypothetical protein DIPPA_24622 [Diplonema papillatum]|nr:hypothetical protein DIPPA_24622 [Diplonema papillatum]
MRREASAVDANGPVVAGLGKGRRARVQGPAEEGRRCPEGLLREVKGRKVEPFYPPAAGRTAQQVLDDAVKKRGLADDPARDGPAKRPRLDLGGERRARLGKHVNDEDLPPAPAISGCYGSSTVTKLVVQSTVTDCCCTSSSKSTDYLLHIKF